MRKQKGSIVIDRDNWVLRFREGQRGDRRLRFKILGEVTAAHRRNKDRATGKLRIPDEIQDAAKEWIKALASTEVSVLTTIGEFWDKKFIPKKEQTLKPGPLYQLKWRWDRFLKARISAKVLRDYQRKDAYDLWEEILADFPRMSRQSMNHVRFTISGIFEAALNQGLYSGQNPAEADLPPNLPGRKKKGAYSVHQVNKMLVLLKGNPQAQAIVALAFASGCRKGELQALHWEDYDQHQHGATIHVRNGSYMGKIQTTKTEASTDEAEIGAEACKYLDAWRELTGRPTHGQMFYNQRDQRKRKGKWLVNLDSYAKRQIKPILAEAGIPWLGWHAFRRGNATFLAKQGNPELRKAATAVLRQTDAGTTETHYIQETGQQRRAAHAANIVSIDRSKRKAAGAIGKGMKAAN